MGKRLSKIYTKTGDAGETGLGDGSRVPKTSLRVEAMGCVDELNSVIGLVVETMVDEASTLLSMITMGDSNLLAEMLPNFPTGHATEPDETDDEALYNQLSIPNEAADEALYYEMTDKLELAETSEELLELAEFLRSIQHRIFDLGGEISIPGHAIIKAAHVKKLEKALDALNKQLPPLENFILPGGSKLVAECHHARAVCRRAERALVLLAESEAINQPGLSYLNRLSDYLFVVARSCARITNVEEVLWEQG